MVGETSVGVVVGEVGRVFGCMSEHGHLVGGAAGFGWHCVSKVSSVGLEWSLSVLLGVRDSTIYLL